MQPIDAVAVGAPVRQPRMKLAQKRGRAGVELDTVYARGHREPGSPTETLDERGDLAGLHLHRQLPRHRVREARRRPQRRLRPRTRPLQPGVPETREHERPVRAARIRHCTPTLLAVRGQRGPFVRPVTPVNRRGLGDDQSGAAAGTTFVVRDVPSGQCAGVAQIGLVRTEEHPGRGDAPGQGERFGEAAAHARGVLADAEIAAEALGDHEVVRAQVVNRLVTQAENRRVDAPRRMSRTFSTPAWPLADRPQR